MIRMRHQSSLNLLFSSVHTTDETATWQVDSMEGDKAYSVTQLHKTCPYNCLMRCNECDICVHMFLCSCPDALIKNSICKHVHLVARTQSKTHTAMDTEDNAHSDPLQEADESEVDESHDNSISPEDRVGQSLLLSTLQDKNELNDASMVRNEVLTTILSLSG